MMTGGHIRNGTAFENRHSIDRMFCIPVDFLYGGKIGIRIGRIELGEDKAGKDAGSFAEHVPDVKQMFRRTDTDEQ